MLDLKQYIIKLFSKMNLKASFEADKESFFLKVNDEVILEVGKG